MNSMISFMRRHRLLTCVSGGSYYIATILLHEEVSKVSVWLENALTIRGYNKVLAVLGIFFISAFSLFVLGRIRKSSDRHFKIFFLLFTLALVIISFKTLFVVNVEYIHFFQYAVLAVPLFALTLHFGGTAYWITLLGAIDEAYQYFILYPTWKYLDFNDIVLNLTGGGIGIVLIYAMLDTKTSGLCSGLSLRRAMKSPPVITSALIASGALLAYMSGLMRFYPKEGSKNALVMLSRAPASKDFWMHFKWGKTCHVLTPAEGVALAVILICTYSLIDWRVGRETCAGG